MDFSDFIKYFIKGFMELFSIYTVQLKADINLKYGFEFSSSGLN